MWRLLNLILTFSGKGILLLTVLSSCSQYVLAPTNDPAVVMVPPTAGAEGLFVEGTLNWNQPKILEEEHAKKTELKKGKVWVNGQWIKTEAGWKYIPGHWKKRNN